jgi:predicted RNA-binding protein with TRAM domain
MVDIPDSLQCLFSASVTPQAGTYRLEIPREEVEQGGLDVDEVYRVAMFTHSSASPPSDSPGVAPSTEPQKQQGPPVDEGEVREVTIETLGEQGDGIAKVKRGYVIIVDGGQPGEVVDVEIQTVRENVAFAEIVESES